MKLNPRVRNYFFGSRKKIWIIFSIIKFFIACFRRLRLKVFKAQNLWMTQIFKKNFTLKKFLKKKLLEEKKFNNKISAQPISKPRFNLMGFLNEVARNFYAWTELLDMIIFTEFLKLIRFFSISPQIYQKYLNPSKFKFFYSNIQKAFIHKFTATWMFLQKRKKLSTEQFSRFLSSSSCTIHSAEYK